MFLYGFIIWNLYSAKMSSYLSSTNRGRTLETLDDIRNENLQLWVTYHVRLSDEIGKKILPLIYYYKENLLPGQLNVDVTREDFDKHIYLLNNSYGYLIKDYAWSYISLAQSLLSKKLFSKSNLCPEQGFIYPIFTFRIIRMRETQEIFYMRVAESGLDYIWEQFSYYDIKFKLIKESKQNFMILGFKYFKIAWIIGFLGIGLSLIIFISEFIYKNGKQKITIKKIVLIIILNNERK